MVARQIKALRRKLELLDKDGDGVLSRNDFCKMLESPHRTRDRIETIRCR